MALSVIVRHLFLLCLTLVSASGLEKGASVLDAQKNFKNFDVLEDLVAEKKLLQNEIQDLERLQASVRRVNITDFRPVDCADLLLNGYTVSGIYSIYPFTCSCSNFIRVYCDMDTDGGGWTVLLNRQPQPVQENFNRTWDDYRRGFGLAGQEYYIGNEYIYRLTTSRDYNVRFDWITTTGVVGNVMYNTFVVEKENLRYRLDLGYKMSGSTTTYSCYSYNDLKYFATYERADTGNCAVTYGGGWWWSSPCRVINSPTGRFDQYMNITCYRNNYENMQVRKYQIKIRPALCESSYRRIAFFNNPCNNHNWA